MGRRNLSRLTLALALASAALSASAAAGAPPFRVLATGKTEGRGQAPHAYLARSRSASWLARLAPADRAKVRKVDFSRSQVGGVFLDGSVCAFDPAITSFSRAGALVRVRVAFTRPPIGVATCIKQDTPYVVFSFARTKTPASRIQVTPVARA